MSDSGPHVTSFADLFTRGVLWKSRPVLESGLDEMV